MKRTISVLLIVFLLPFVLSLSPTVYDPNYVAKYQSPEGIQFLSYTHTWNKEKLENLYKELLRNQHGPELNTLREVRIKGETNPTKTGDYNPATNVITLYDGDAQNTIESMRRVLSHEYGHHFAFYYVPQHVLPISTKWKTLRGAEDTFSLSFWNYSTEGNHKWFTPEIFAEDYVMLYGSTRKVSNEDIANGTVFQHMVKHENEYLPNVLEDIPLQRYVEKVSGLQVDTKRIIKVPQFVGLKNNIITFEIMKRENILYRFSFDYYEGNKKVQTPENWVHRGSYAFTSTPDTNGRISINLEDTLLEEQKDTFTGSVQITVEAVDLNTNLGLKKDLFSLKYGADKKFTK